MPEYFNIDWSDLNDSRDATSYVLVAGFRAIDRHLNDLVGTLERLADPDRRR